MATKKYSCRKCRCHLFDDKCVLTDSTDDGTVWYIDGDLAPEWIHKNIHKAQWTKGRLSCPKCKGRVGSFDFISPSKSASTAPPIHILRSRVDSPNAVPIPIRSIPAAHVAQRRASSSWIVPKVISLSDRENVTPNAVVSLERSSEAKNSKESRFPDIPPNQFKAFTVVDRPAGDLTTCSASHTYVSPLHVTFCDKSPPSSDSSISSDIQSDSNTEHLLQDSNYMNVIYSNNRLQGEIIGEEKQDENNVVSVKMNQYRLPEMVCRQSDAALDMISNTTAIPTADIDNLKNDLGDLTETLDKTEHNEDYEHHSSRSSSWLSHAGENPEHYSDKCTHSTPPSPKNDVIDKKLFLDTKLTSFQYEKTEIGTTAGLNTTSSDCITINKNDKITVNVSVAENNSDWVAENCSNNTPGSNVDQQLGPRRSRKKKKHVRHWKPDTDDDPEVDLAISDNSLIDEQDSAVTHRNQFDVLEEEVVEKPWSQPSNTEIFPSYPDEHVCPVCLDLYCNPMRVSPCEHMFCDPCLRRLATDKPVLTPCPLCRQMITSCLRQNEFIGTLKDLYPVQYKERLQSERKFLSSKFYKLPMQHASRSINNPAQQRLASPSVLEFYGLRNVVILLVFTLMRFYLECVNGSSHTIKYLLKFLCVALIGLLMSMLFMSMGYFLVGVFTMLYYVAEFAFVSIAGLYRTVVLDINNEFSYHWNGTTDYSASNANLTVVLLVCSFIVFKVYRKLIRN